LPEAVDTKVAAAAHTALVERLELKIIRSAGGLAIASDTLAVAAANATDIHFLHVERVASAVATAAKVVPVADIAQVQVARAATDSACIHPAGAVSDTLTVHAGILPSAYSARVDPVLSKRYPETIDARVQTVANVTSVPLGSSVEHSGAVYTSVHSAANAARVVRAATERNAGTIEADVKPVALLAPVPLVRTEGNALAVNALVQPTANATLVV